MTTYTVVSQKRAHGQCILLYAQLNTVKPEILAVIKFGSLAQNDVFNTIIGIKFGGMVRYRHTYMHA